MGAVGARKRFGLAGRRLQQKFEFERLLQTGKRRNLSGYSFFMAPSGVQGPRLGILVSRKHAARAVERNRLKRCIREAFRLEQDNIGAFDVLVRPPYGIRPSRDMVNQLRELLCRLTA